MKYHDYHLDKYEVTDRGKTISFHLVYGYEGEETDVSNITFSEVALYNFIHTDNAIITDIYEIEPTKLIEEISSEVTEWNRMYRVNLWEENPEAYGIKLESLGFKAWCIESAIGFYGFIIAKEVSNA
ncbi:MAG: hypothetical protein V7721_03620 [Porticoccaceae bacterium]